MTARQIAHDIWKVEQTTARKVSYVGMIRLYQDGRYVAARDGNVYGPYDTLEEAEKFFEEDNSINTK